MTPDYRRIHQLEYELGFRDDPPPSRAVWTDEPGAIIYYDGSAAARIALTEQIANRHS